MKINLKILLRRLFFAFCLYTFIFAVAVPVNMAGNWYQQFLPNLPNLQVSDMYFLDSLTGFIVTGNSTPNDTSGYILKTTNGGDNWVLKFTDRRDFTRVKFLNKDTGFVSGQFGSGARLYKTTNAGESWFSINIPGGGRFILMTWLY